MKEYEELLAEFDDLAERYEFVINECGRLTRYIGDMQKELDAYKELLGRWIAVAKLFRDRFWRNCGYTIDIEPIPLPPEKPEGM